MDLMGHSDDEPDAISDFVRAVQAHVEEAIEVGRQESAEEIESLRQQLRGAVEALEQIEAGHSCATDRQGVAQLREIARRWLTTNRGQ